MFHVFQSTLPSQGATIIHFYMCEIGFISIHAPLTGSDLPLSQYKDVIIISIHAPLTGSDHLTQLHTHYEVISIHAPLTGSDNTSNIDRIRAPYFNPRSPHRERQQKN